MVGILTVSRYAIPARNPRYEVWVGWDPPLQTYFLQVYDRQGAEEEQPFVWLEANLVRHIATHRR